MNVLLGWLQVLLALHTAVGAVWKSSNSERTLPTLGAIPHGVWVSLIAVELLCSIGLVTPISNRRLAILAPVAAILVAAEMLLFVSVDLASGSKSFGEVIYWLVVAGIAAFIAYGRLVLKPMRRSEFA